MGKFVIKKAAKGFMFNLLAGNNQVIATSEVYSSLASCKNGIDSVKKNAVAAAIEDQTVEGFKTEKNPKFEIYADKKGEIRFRLKAANGEIIATGEGYKAKAGCKNGIESIKKNAPEAEIDDRTAE
ncbi:MAG: YegP family protein [Paludibacteraceae bacterium]|nr:YegP family protein [Paludibacteraceae bacterium]MBR5973228.1 YegP family protein [Paludibacteraceae bacterium]